VEEDEEPVEGDVVVAELEAVVVELQVVVARAGGEVVPEVLEKDRMTKVSHDVVVMRREAGEELAVEVIQTGDGGRSQEVSTAALDRR